MSNSIATRPKFDLFKGKKQGDVSFHANTNIKRVA